VAHRYTWFNNNAPHALVVQTWDDEDDWRQLHFDILANDPEVTEALKPIMEEYVKDIHEYHTKDEDNDKEA